MQSVNRFLGKYGNLLILLLILVLGAYFRLKGLDHGLPYIYDPDEPSFMDIANNMLENANLDPVWYGAPGSTTIYLLLLSNLGVFMVTLVLGYQLDIPEFVKWQSIDPTWTYLSGRFVIVIFSILTIWLVYKTAQRMFGDLAAYLAALLLAISPLIIDNAQLIRPDAQAAFFMLVTFWFCLNILDRAKWEDYLWAGFFVGIAAVTKYPALVICLVVLLAHLLRAKESPQEHYKIIGSGAVSVIGVVVGSPYLLFNFPKVIDDVLQENRTTHLGSTGEGFVRNILWYFNTPVLQNLTFLGLVLCILGLFLLCFSKNKQYLILAAAPILFICFISSLHLRVQRWVIPAVPFLYITITYALSQINQWLKARMNKNLALAAPSLLALAMILPLVVNSYALANRLSNTDTRTIAKDWIHEHIPEGSRIVVEGFTPQLTRGHFETFAVIDGLLEQKWQNLDSIPFIRPVGQLGKLTNAESLIDKDIDYIVLSNFYDRYLAEEERYPEIVKMYQTIMENSELIYTISPAKDIPGVVIRVYKVIK